MRLVGLDGGGPDHGSGALAVPDLFFPEDRRRVAEEFLPRVLADGHGEIEVRFRHLGTGDPVWVRAWPWAGTRCVSPTVPRPWAAGSTCSSSPCPRGQSSWRRSRAAWRRRRASPRAAGAWPTCWPGTWPTGSWSRRPRWGSRSSPDHWPGGLPVR